MKNIIKAFFAAATVAALAMVAKSGEPTNHAKSESVTPVIIRDDTGLN